MAAYFYIYLIICFFLSVYFTKISKPKYPFLTFMFCFWIFVGDVANMEGMKINIGGAFDLQPLRILFLISVMFLIVDPFIQQYKKYKEIQFKIQPDYEKYLIAFSITTSISYIIYTGTNPAKLFVALSTILSFVVIYFTVKRAADEGMKNAIKLSLITAAVISCFIAIYQLIGDQSFFRVNPDYGRSAFGGLLRSTGVFRDDYMHSYVVFSALVWVSFTDFKGLKKNVLIGIFLLGILIAFMRMGYIVVAFFIAHAIIYASSAHIKLKILVVTLSVIIGILGVFLVLTSGVMESSVAQERMMDEGTMELRFKLYEKALEVSFSDLKGILVGYGGTESTEYYNAMYDVTQNEAWALGERGGWHNLFISTLFFNGLPATILLLITLVSIAKYYYSLSKNYDIKNYYIPFYICIGYLIANITLSLELVTNFAIILSISTAVILHIRESQIFSERKNESERVA